MQKLLLTTDQNVPIEVELATIGQRLLATFIDVIFMGIYFYIMILMLTFGFARSFDVFDPRSYDIWLFMFVFIVFLPFILYTPLTEFLFKGQTIGKRLLGLRVMKSNGENASFKDYFTRWLFRPMEVYFILFAMEGLGLIFLFSSFFFDTLIGSISLKNQRIGDFMANTVVLKIKPTTHYSVSDILAMKSQEGFTAEYPEITIYTDEDMMLVKNVINRVKTYRNQESKDLAIQLADKIAEDLKLESPPPKKMKFLETILNEYVVLTR